MIASLKQRILSSDTVFISFPKAGRTWIRFFLAKYFELKNKTPFDLELTEHKVLFSHNYFDLYQDEYGVPSFMFEEQLASKKVVFILRDPRDIAVSYYYQKKFREKVISETVTIDEFVLSEIHGIERFSIFMLQLLDFQEKKILPGSTIVLYENLLKYPLFFFKKILKSMDIEIDELVLEQAIKESSFERMQEYELSLLNNNIQIPANRLGLPEWTGDKNELKVRDCKQGLYLDELKEETISKINTGYTKRLIEKINFLIHE